MESGALLTTQVGILLLLLVACLGAIAFKRLHFPYTVGQFLGVGLRRRISRLWNPPFSELSHELILLVFVPPLVFASAINIDLRLLIRSLLPNLMLAGLLLSTAIIGLILSQLTPLTLPQAFFSLISRRIPLRLLFYFKNWVSRKADDSGRGKVCSMMQPRSSRSVLF